MGRQGVHVFAPPAQLPEQGIRLPDGSTHTFLAAEEKGVDVRMALDIVRMAHRREYDVALILSQDQDLSESRQRSGRSRASRGGGSRSPPPSPSAPVPSNRRGIDKTDWIRIDRATYDACLDRRDYRGGSRRPRVAAANSPS